MPGHDERRALAIYLQDHHAAACAGTAVARRLSDHASGDIGAVVDLSQVATEISEDLATLERIMEAEGVPRSSVKDFLAIVAERIARLKPNGRLFTRSRLSDVIEAETLVVGITGKEALWRTLAAADGGTRANYSELIERAQNQRKSVARARDYAASVAFGEIEQ